MSIALLGYELFDESYRPSKLFFLSQAESKSAISILLRSEKIKCVFPVMPISGRCMTVALPPCLLIVAANILAMASSPRHGSCPKFDEGSDAILSP